MRLLGFSCWTHLGLNHPGCLPVELQCIWSVPTLTSRPRCSAQLSVLPPLATYSVATNIFTAQGELPGSSHLAHLHLLKITVFSPPTSLDHSHHFLMFLDSFLELETSGTCSDFQGRMIQKSQVVSKPSLFDDLAIARLPTYQLMTRWRCLTFQDPSSAAASNGFGERERARALPSSTQKEAFKTRLADFTLSCFPIGCNLHVIIAY